MKTNDPVIKITFQAHESDRELLKILAAKARISQSEFMRRLIYDYGDQLVAVERGAGFKPGDYTMVAVEPEADNRVVEVNNLNPLGLSVSDEEKAKMRGVVVRKFGVDFYSHGGALTLNPEEVTDTGATYGVHERTHASGWTIKGEIHEDYYTWVNGFEAHHPEYGRVWGDFEEEVYADSEEGFNHFYENHTPEPWDYGDI